MNLIVSLIVAAIVGYLVYWVLVFLGLIYPIPQLAGILAFILCLFGGRNYSGYPWKW